MATDTGRPRARRRKRPPRAGRRQKTPVRRRRAPGPGKRKKSLRRNLLVLLRLVFLFVFCFSAYRLASELLRARRETAAFDELSALVASASERTAAPAMPPPTAAPATNAPGAGTGSAESTPPPEPTPTPEPLPLAQYAPLLEMNPDFFGWLSIEGAGIDYPVMYSPARPEYYLNRAFDGSYSGSGVPFIDAKCPADGNFYLIYGHHMQNKTMFGKLPKYAERSFYEQNPIIRFDTAYEQREYRVIAAFYSQVYLTGDTGVFRYYNYTDLTDPDVFDEYMAQVRAAAIYDTGQDAVYGDELIALSTCNYHTAEGRFVVVAKRIS